MHTPSLIPHYAYPITHTHPLCIPHHAPYIVCMLTMTSDPCRTEVCTLLLCHGADPTLVNCHSKSAIDLSPTDDLKQKIECECDPHVRHVDDSSQCHVFLDEFKGHMHLEYAHKGDVAKMKKTLSPKLANFQHPQTRDTPLVCPPYL